MKRSHVAQGLPKAGRSTLKCGARVFIRMSLVAAGSLGCLWSCSNSGKPSNEVTSTTKQTVIFDQNHGSGNTGFVFLPPLVRPPAAYGDIVPDAPVTVRIDQLGSDGTTLRTLATFTRSSGPRGEHLRIHYQGKPCDSDDHDGDAESMGYYYARWMTQGMGLDPSASYRIRVLVPDKGGQTRELGYADIDLVLTRAEFRSVDTQEFVPLLSGSTLRIKFRVDWPAVDRDRDGVFDWLDNCPSEVNPGQTDSLGNGVGDRCRCNSVTCRATQLCHVAGTCQPTTGTCTDPIEQDGTSCTSANAMGVCVEGACQLNGCVEGYGDCDHDLGSGCETATTADGNCGACGITCPSGANARGACEAGICRLACEPGYSDCDQDPANGCERYVQTDPGNCGVCGNVCAPNETCRRGSCSTLVCVDPREDCNGQIEDGCETSLDEVQHCGSCEVSCSFANAQAMCSSGRTCVIKACESGHADCNHIYDDGCESRVTDDIRNCGSCGNVCSFAFATAACENGSCKIAACSPGHADCDGSVYNGCEANLQSDLKHCAACGNACTRPNAVASCSTGTCVVVSCLPGFADCDGLAENGCEAALPSDPNNCGACGSVCTIAGPHSVPACKSGTCGLECEAGYGDCDGDLTNGCETDVTDNCGVCECTFAHATGECINGSCSFSVCQAGYGDCDGLQSNGCETDLGTRCGACNPTCDDGNPCTWDMCTGAGCIHDAGIKNMECRARAWSNGMDSCGAQSSVCQPINATQYECLYTPSPDGAPCRPLLMPSGLNFCYDAGTCLSGVCQGTKPKSCPSRICTTATCEPATGNCVYTAAGGITRCSPSPCAYGTCQGDFCHGVYTLFCSSMSYTNPPDACHTSSGSCVNGCYTNALPDGTSCGNGNPCDGEETCIGGKCMAGIPPADGTTCGASAECVSNVCTEKT